MTKDELAISLSLLRLSPADLARLVDVTPRAVGLWLSGDRGVPGPVGAYLSLFSAMTSQQQADERRKLQIVSKKMKDGLYSIEYAANAGVGFGVLVFEGGRVYGSDVLKGKYDGTYQTNPTTGMTDVGLRVEMPPNVPSVLGPAQPFSWNVDVTTSIDSNLDEGSIVVATNMGQATAKYRFMRPLPE